MRLKKLFGAFLASAMLALSALALVSCGGPSHEDVLRQQLTSELDAVKNVSDEMVAEFVKGAGGEGMFAEFGVSDREFCEAYFAGFDYSIDSIVVEGDTATITLTIVARHVGDFNTAFQENVEAFVASPEAQAVSSEEEANKKVGQILLDTVKNLKPAASEPIELTYNLVDGVWTPAPGSDDVLAGAMF